MVDNVSNGATPPAETPDIQKQIQDAVEKAVGGLKAKNAELLGEVKTARESLKAWEGLEPDKIKQILTQFEGDEDARDIRDGKVQNVVDRRVKDQVTRAQAQVEKETKAREEATKRADDLQIRYERSVVSNIVAQLVTGLADGALAPIQLFAEKWFCVDSEGNVKPTASAPIWPAAEPLTVDKLKNYLQEVSPFYFRPPTGGGTVSGKSGGAPTKKRAAMTPAEKARLIGEIGSEAYLALP